MTTYKGNSGNLMQHWTLCEIVNIADEQYVPGLNFIDAHAMAPIAHTLDGNGDDKFREVRGSLPGRHSLYERAWHQLVPNGGYPNSANFVKHIWTREYAMLLCEKNPATVTALDTWLPSIQGQPRCKRAKVFSGDWRDRFREGLPRPWQVGLPNGSLTLVSFDPYMYNRTRRFDDAEQRCKGILYRDDMHRALGAMQALSGPVLIQLSTYGTNDNNGPDAVIDSLDCILRKENFTPNAPVRIPQT